MVTLPYKSRVSSEPDKEGASGGKEDGTKREGGEGDTGGEATGGQGLVTGDESTYIHIIMSTIFISERPC